MMKEYMQLEKLRYNDGPDMEVNVKGDLTGKQIAPFLLLPFIEYSFKQSNANTEQAWINIDINIEGNSFSMKLANGVAQDNNAEIPFSGDLTNVQKRLALLYPQTHELKISREQEMLIVFLNIRLDDINITETETDKESVITKPMEAQPTIYASQ